MVFVSNQTVRASVWHDEGGCFASSDPVVMDSGNACQLAKCFVRIDRSDIVLMRRALFDLSQPLCILRDKSDSGICLREKNLMVEHFRVPLYSNALL